MKWVAFDADDTLWHCERFFQISQQGFSQLLSEFAEPDTLSQHLLAVERKNLELYGYGTKAFTLSMIETALEVTSGRVSTEVISKIMAMGREMLSHPIELLPNVAETLEVMAGDYRLALVTKGDLFDQERKIAQSGLAERFEVIEIVPEKDEATYRRIFSRLGVSTGHVAMVGNSLKSDVLPAAAAGGWGIHLPHELEWELDRAEADTLPDRCLRIDAMPELPETISGIAGN